MRFSSLPDITEIPTITVTELPLEILEPTRGNIEALIIDAAKDTIAREHENHTLDVLENSSEVIRKGVYQMFFYFICSTAFLGFVNPKPFAHSFFISLR